MTATFYDLQRDDNPRNRQVLNDQRSVVDLFDEIRLVQPPCMYQFVGDHGFSLTVGVDRTSEYVQHSTNDGSPPYLMATASSPDDRDMSFLIGDTAIPIAGRYRLPSELVRQIVTAFVESGDRMAGINWIEFQ